MVIKMKRIYLICDNRVEGREIDYYIYVGFTFSRKTTIIKKIKLWDVISRSYKKQKVRIKKISKEGWEVIK